MLAAIAFWLIGRRGAGSQLLDTSSMPVVSNSLRAYWKPYRGDLRTCRAFSRADRCTWCIYITLLLEAGGEQSCELLYIGVLLQVFTLESRLRRKGLSEMSLAISFFITMRYDALQVWRVRCFLHLRSAMIDDVRPA